MTTPPAAQVEELIAVFDPGEKNREQHRWGDRLVIGVGNVAAWLFPLLIVAIVSQVVIRQAGHNQAWLDDLQWWMYGFASLVGFAYAITTNSHVRVDILHVNYSEAKRARIEIFAVGWLLLPFLLLMTDVLVHYAFASWTANEGSDSPNGLHKLYLLKISLPIVFAMAMLAAWMVLRRNVATLRTPTLAAMIVAGFPAVWFAMERAIYYALWWVTRFTSPELHPRRISREPLLQDTGLYALAVLLVILAVGYFSRRRSTGDA